MNAADFLKLWNPDPTESERREQINLEAEAGMYAADPFDPEPIASCRVCGCTDDRACPGGCIWAEADLCSRCVR